MKRKFLIYILSAACVLSCTAPAFAEEEAEALEMISVDEEEAEEKIIGEKSEEGFQVKLKNMTGKDIQGVSVKEMEEEEFPENFLKEEDVFAAEEERTLYFNPEEEEENEEAEDASAEAEQTDANKPEEKLLTPGYDIEISFSEEETFVLHAFPFEDIEEGELLLEDNVVFVKYTSKSTEEEISTKEAELAIANPVSAEQGTDAGAVQTTQDSTYQEPTYQEPTYQEPTYQEPTYQEPTYQEPTYQEPVYQEPTYEEPTYQEPVYEEPTYQEPTAGGDDGCLNGGVFYE